jgi:hypothetical protein
MEMMMDIVDIQWPKYSQSMSAEGREVIRPGYSGLAYVTGSEVAGARSQVSEYVEVQAPRA